MDRLQNAFHKDAQAFLVCGASMIVLIASSMLCHDQGECKKEEAWAVACSTVSTGLTFFYALLAWFKPSMSEALAPYLSCFLAIWWFPGAFVLTFRAPFVAVGNGYFGSWAALVFSIQWFQLAGDVIFAKIPGMAAKPTTEANAPLGGMPHSNI